MPKDEENEAVAAVERLAERLRSQLERLDPTDNAEAPWVELSEEERGLYRAVVRDLIRFASDIEAARGIYSSSPARTM